MTSHCDVTTDLKICPFLALTEPRNSATQCHGDFIYGQGVGLKKVSSKKQFGVMTSHPLPRYGPLKSDFLRFLPFTAPNIFATKHIWKACFTHVLEHSYGPNISKGAHPNRYGYAQRPPPSRVLRFWTKTGQAITRDPSVLGPSNFGFRESPLSTFEICNRL